MKRNELQPPAAQLMKYIVGRWISKPIYVAAELGIADKLSDGPKSIDELAQLTQTHAPTLFRVMRGLASVGIFSETENKRFELTPMAECLKTGALRSAALLFNSHWSDKAWEYFLDSVKTGDTAFEKAHGMPVSDWLEKNPHAAEVFNEANATKAANSHRAIVDVYDFSDINKLTDVGGGLGVLMAEVLQANPLMKGIVADIPSVVQKAKKMIQDRGLEERCEAVECDFFDKIPGGSDAYLMSNILHDWSDEQCIKILGNCHKAMECGSKLLIVEMVIPPGNEPSIAKLLDIEMLVTTGGRERTEFEFKALLESSGFKLNRFIPTAENICIIETSKGLICSEATGNY
ncbi:MAG: methyltransferase [Desulfobacteraceae bacterium]|nr:methyltransferase [Desulfobacteraceae bacterium]